MCTREVVCCRLPVCVLERLRVVGCHCAYHEDAEGVEAPTVVG